MSALDAVDIGTDDRDYLSRKRKVRFVMDIITTSIVSCIGSCSCIPLLAVYSSVNVRSIQFYLRFKLVLR